MTDALFAACTRLVLLHEEFHGLDQALRHKEGEAIQPAGGTAHFYYLKDKVDFLLTRIDNMLRHESALLHQACREAQKKDAAP